jgi:hypothetical protein
MCSPTSPMGQRRSTPTASPTGSSGWPASYRDLLARTLGRPRAELSSGEAARLELAAEAEPWLLARASGWRVVAGHLAGLAGLAGILAFRENQLAASRPFPHFGVGNTYTYRISSPLRKARLFAMSHPHY